MILATLDVFGGALRFIVDRHDLILEKTWEHVLLSAAALAVSIAIAVPVGVLLGHRHRGSFLAVNLANIGRALPTLVVIAVGFTFLGLGVGIGRWAIDRVYRHVAAARINGLDGLFGSACGQKRGQRES